MFVSPFGAVTIGSLVIFLTIWTAFWYSHKGAAYVFFDPQDCVKFCAEKREYPLAAEKATFEPMLKHYIGVAQLLITVAAASIALGGEKNPQPALLILIAKGLLAWSIFYGLLFCAFVLYRYDEYTQDRTSYTRRWYSTVESLGFSTLVCFMFGYLAWGWGLSR
jgi:hypothetical protein